MSAQQLKPHAQRTELIKAAVVLAIAFSGWFIPAPAPMTQVGMETFTVFLSMVVGWTLTGDAWPSFMGIILFPLTGVENMTQFLASGWGSQAFFFMVLSFAMVGYMNTCGLSKFLVEWLMTRKFIVGHPWRLIFMILFAAYVVCSLVNNVIGLFLMWEIVYGITAVIDQKPYDKFPSIMVFGIAMQSAFSLSAMPWGGNSIANLGVYANVAGAPANFLQYVSFTVPFGFIQILAYMLLIKLVFRLDVKPLSSVRPEDIAPDGVHTTPQVKIGMGLLVLFIAMLLIPSLFPVGSPAQAFYARFGTVGIFVLFFAIISLLFYKNERVFIFADQSKQNIPWNMLIMVTVILAIGGCLMNDATGIAPFLAQKVVPLLTSVPPWAFMIVLVLVETILTNFLINMVVVALLLPVIMPICPDLGLNPTVVAFTIMVVSTNAILTPAGCAAAAFLFPNKKWIRAKDIYKYGTPTVIINMIILVLYYFLFSVIL